jgi:hypothetical protein
MRLNDEAQRAYSVQDYAAPPAIQGVELVDLRRFTDDGGNFTELGRRGNGVHAGFPGFEVKQINYSELEPGAIKAFHIHRGQTDVWFVPPSDKILVPPMHGARPRKRWRGGSSWATAPRASCAFRRAWRMA